MVPAVNRGSVESERGREQLSQSIPEEIEQEGSDGVEEQLSPVPCIHAYLWQGASVIRGFTPLLEQGGKRRASVNRSYLSPSTDYGLRLRMVLITGLQLMEVTSLCDVSSGLESREKYFRLNTCRFSPLVGVAPV